MSQLDTLVAARPPKARIAWLDVAKGVGMVLVFYGHFVQRFDQVAVPIAATHLKWVYSFHMPLFFFISGFVYKPRAMGLGAFLGRQVRTRLVPVWFFCFVSMWLWLANEVRLGSGGYVGVHGWGGTAVHLSREMLVVIVQGRPNWNGVVWFLVCLSTAEIIQFLLQDYLRRNWALVVSIGVFTGMAAFVNAQGELFHELLGVRPRWWYIAPAMGALVFYQLGILLRRSALLIKAVPKWVQAVLAVGFLGGVTFTFDLNTGFGADRQYQVVTLMSGVYGELGWFLLTALLGTLFVVYVSQLLGESRLFTYIGQITLPLMCLNGILLSAVNPLMTALVLRIVSPEQVWAFTALCIVSTAAQLAACVPVIWGLQRWLPEVIGQPRRRAV